MTALVLLLAGSAAAAPLKIEWSVSSGPWSSASSASPLAGQQVRLRVDAPPGAKVRWYQLIPDLDTMYKNANFPWEKLCCRPTYVAFPPRMLLADLLLGI